MKNKALALLIAATMLAGLFAACASGAEPEPPLDQPEEGASLPCFPIVAEEFWSDENRDAILSFSQSLFREVVALAEDNPVISPLSAYFALAMVALGARGETQAEFETVLGSEPAELALALRTLSQSLTDTDGNTTLNIAGGVWTADDFIIEPSFAELLLAYFDAPAVSRDFQAPATADEINAWIHERTEGLIEDMIQSISRDTVMLLVNTLYFSARWAETFGPLTGISDVFHTASGQEVETPFLFTRPESFAVRVTDRYEAVSLPYDDDRLGFLLVRPTDGADLRAFAADFDLAAVLGGLEMRDNVQVHMPKLDLEFEVSLNEILQALGLTLAFGDFADFSGLSAEDEDLYISSVLQKVRLLVDEEGTEAAAATVVGIERMGIAFDLLDLRFDSPYLYVIYDRLTGVPLFMGLVEEF